MAPVATACCAARPHGAHSVLPAQPTPLPLCSPRQAWESAWFVRLLRHAPGWAMNVIADVLAYLLFNPVTLWCALRAVHAVLAAA